ncbi:hypothetical protein [Chryseobacterium sp. IT-36CA2]|uniref:hypothetical protein n=1 Tax=Chryseobacterium sp. IT-36CA2 TaxID=3026460 RepID=UPI0039E12544
MKSPQQQLKFLFPFYKGASLLLFLIFLVPDAEAQVLYIKDTQITIGKNTTVYVANSGEVHEEDLKNFEIKTPEKKRGLKSRKQRKFPFNADPVKNSAKRPAEKTKTYPIVKSQEWAAPHPDDFFSAYQKGEAISVSVTVHYYPNFSIENKKLKLIHGYFNRANNKIVGNSFILFKDYYWFQCKNRPPPTSFI